MTDPFSAELSSPLPSVTVSGTGLSSGAATVYNDGTWARAGATLANGSNYYAATATDSIGSHRSSQDTVTVTLSNTVAFTYDANGNLLNDGQRYFSYDDENELISVTVSNAWRSEFSYDGLMRRRKRIEYTWSGGAWLKTNDTRYVIDNRLVAQERGGDNLPRVAYTRGHDLSGSREGAGGIGGLLARSDMAAASVAYYHFDGNGNVTCLLNANGLILARYAYDAFGNILAKTGPLSDANLYRFSSKESSANSGILYYGFRFYDPNLQRWLNRDPIEEFGGLNLYQFAGNNPTCWVDPFGLDWTDYIPNWIFPAANFSAGMGDVISFTGTRLVRRALDYDDVVNKCSGAYGAGRWAGIAHGALMGGGRLAYAGIAKAESLALLRSGATAANAEKAIAFRNGLKEAFNLGMANKDKVMTMEKAMAKYTGDYAEIIKASGRTSRAWNAAGAAALGSAAVGAASDPCH